MTIGCTRCGASQEGNILLPVIVFKFPHKKGCGMGIGPLAVIPTHKKVKVENIPEPLHIADVIVELEPKKSNPIVEKLKVFGKQEKSDA